MILQIHLVLLAIGLIVSYYKVIHQPAKLYKQALKSEPYDVIIVPGLPYDPGKWNPFLKSRMIWANYLYKSKIAKNIIYSGSAVYTPYREGKIMKMYGLKLGMPDSVLYTEVRAEHSTENLWYSYHLAKEMGFKSIALATDPIQNMFLMKFAEKKNLEVDFIPFIISKVHYMEKPDFKIDPSPAFDSTFVSIKERETVWERMDGTMGNRIDYNAK